MSLAAFLLRVVLAAVFLRAGTVKVSNLSAFRQAIYGYELLPARLVGAASYGVPAIELLVGALLVVGIELRPVAVGAAIVLVVFAAAIAVNLLRGRRISCGCFGWTTAEISWGHVIMSGALAGAAVMVAAWPAEPLAAVPGVADPHGTAAWTSTAIASLLIASSVGVGALLFAEARRVLVLLRAIDGAGEADVR